MAQKTIMPKGGMIAADGQLSQAGHHYLAQIEKLAPLLQQIADAQIDGGGLGALAFLSTVDRAHVSGLGMILLGNEEIAVETAFISSTATIPADDTIPQITEGVEVLTGTYTPKAIGSTLEIEFYGMVGAGGTAAFLCSAMFIDGGADAVTAMWAQNSSSTGILPGRILYRVVTESLDGISVAVRIGLHSGTVYLNGAGIRLGGGVARSNIIVREYLEI